MTNANQLVKSKMSQAIALFEQIHAPGYELNGKTQRATFIQRAQAEIVDPKTGVVSCSKHCASTYFQNISNMVNKNMPLYAYNKYKPKSKAPITKTEVKAAEQQVLLMLPLLEKQRWMVVDENGQEVNNFKSRTEAQAFAKVNDLKWADRTKVA